MTNAYDEKARELADEFDVGDYVRPRVFGGPEYFTESLRADIRIAVSAALAACAREERLDEARWWHGSDANVSKVHAAYHLQWEGAEGFECAACKRIAALDQAAGGKEKGEER